MCEVSEKLKEEGREEGRIEGAENTIIALIKKGLLSIADGAKMLNISEVALKKKLN